MQKKIALRYTGGGYGGFLPGVPARDLISDEVERYGVKQALVESGLYVEAGETKQASGPTENKSAVEAPEA